jgi:hypothetical protein
MNKRRRPSNTQAVPTNVALDSLAAKQKQIDDEVKMHELLILSSCFFMIPGVYAFLNDVPLLGLLSCFVTFVSINYWRDAVEGWRRDADLFVAKASFCIYFIIGVVHIRDWHLLLAGWPNTAIMLGSYYLSDMLWQKGSPNWIYCHMAFHLSVSFGQLIVVHGSYVAYEQQ